MRRRRIQRSGDVVGGGGEVDEIVDRAQGRDLRGNRAADQRGLREVRIDEGLGLGPQVVRVRQRRNEPGSGVPLRRCRPTSPAGAASTSLRASTGACMFTSPPGSPRRCIPRPPRPLPPGPTRLAPRVPPVRVLTRLKLPGGRAIPGIPSLPTPPTRPTQGVGKTASQGTALPWPNPSGQRRSCRSRCGAGPSRRAPLASTGAASGELRP